MADTRAGHAGRRGAATPPPAHRPHATALCRGLPQRHVRAPALPRGSLTWALAGPLALQRTERAAVLLRADRPRFREVVAQHRGRTEPHLARNPVHRPVGGLLHLLGPHHALAGDPGMRGRAGLGPEATGERPR